jgi:hypothetical protein
MRVVETVQIPSGPFGSGTAAAPAAQVSGPSRLGMTLPQALSDLRTGLADERTTPEQLKTMIAHVRSAREKTRKDLEAAQKELLLVITPDQESILVGLGYID